MHLAAFDALGLQSVYLPFNVHPKVLKKAVESIIPLGFKGINITIPHKEKVIPFLDRLAPEAQAIGAVNTIEIASGQLIGHNTDGLGFLRSLTEENIDPSVMPVLLIGSGGATKGVAMALLSVGVPEVVIMARNLDKREALAAQLAAYSSQYKISSIGFNLEKSQAILDLKSLLLINTTPLGMQEDDPLPFPAKHIRPEWVVADLIYQPEETSLMKAAKNMGAKTVSGLGMLLYQGALAFEIWTQKKPPINVMKRALLGAILKGKSA